MGIRSFSARRQSGGRSPFPRPVAAIFVALALLLTVAVVRNLGRHDEMTRWRTSLEDEAGHPAWPAWSSAWPPLPTPQRRRRPLPRDLSGPYAFAATNQQLLKQIPCYCGCVREGHESVLQCFLTGSRADGAPLWTDHSFDCELCIHIAREVMLMSSKGQSAPGIRREIERRYENAGMPTRTPVPGTAHQAPH